LVDRRVVKRFLYLIFMSVKKQQLKDMHDIDGYYNIEFLKNYFNLIKNNT